MKVSGNPSLVKTDAGAIINVDQKSFMLKKKASEERKKMKSKLEMLEERIDILERRIEEITCQ